MNDSMGCTDFMWTSLSKILPATALRSSSENVLVRRGFVCVRLPKAVTFMCTGVWSLLVKIRVWFAPDLKHLLALLCQAFCLEKLLFCFEGCVSRQELHKSLSFWSSRVRSAVERGVEGAKARWCTWVCILESQYSETVGNTFLIPHPVPSERVQNR